MEDLNKINYDEFYNKVGARQGWDFSKISYSKIKSADFDYYKFLSDNIKDNHIVLDIGCGDSKKVIKYVNAKKIIGIDNTEAMLKKSMENFEKSLKKSEHQFLKMDAFGKYDFDDNSFDFVINRHCGCNEREMYRILKKDGIYIQEDIDETDCLELKVLFQRGQSYPIIERSSDKLQQIYEELGFSEIQFYPIREVEYYKTENDLRYLLENTPIIPNFGLGENDEKLFQDYCKIHKTKDGIRLDRELYGFILKK